MRSPLKPRRSGAQTPSPENPAADAAAAPVQESVTSDTGTSLEHLRASSGADATGATGMPQRPSLADKEAPPVLVKVRPPFLVALSRILWIASLAAGAAGVIYMFVIRQAQLPAIADLVRAVDGTRQEATYTTAADILFWTVFTPAVVVILLQIMLQVSFAARRPNVRWWQFGSLMFSGGVFLLAREIVAFGERGAPLEQIMLVQLALATLGLLVSALPPALAWTARKHDIRRGPVAPSAGAGI